METTAYIALGSNQGNREELIRAAIALLRELPDITVTRQSSLMENPAIGGPAGSPDFLNCVVEIQTPDSSRKLLHHLLQIEKQLGRTRREKWGPRTIDLDIILFGEQIIDEPDLKIPHPRMHERRFVLEPLAQIAPQLNHPVLKRPISQLLHDL